MKYITIAFVVLMMVSCTKQTAFNTGDTGIFGKWNIINDSTYSGVGNTNHLVTYYGKRGDYFDFRSDGKIYLKEDTDFDTLTYKIISDSAIIIQSFGLIFNGVPDTSHINFTTGNITIASPADITPGGIFSRTIHLNR